MGDHREQRRRCAMLPERLRQPPARMSLSARPPWTVATTQGFARSGLNSSTGSRPERPSPRKSAKRGAHAVIPPRENATLWKHRLLLESRGTRHCARRNTSTGAFDQSGTDATARSRAAPRRNLSGHFVRKFPAGTYGARLRSAGRRTPSPRRAAERLHCARKPNHRVRWIRASGERGNALVTAFAQHSS